MATLGTIATDRTRSLGAGGRSPASALTGGYHLAYLVGAVAVASGIVIAVSMLRPPRSSTASDESKVVELETAEHVRQPRAA